MVSRRKFLKAGAAAGATLLIPKTGWAQGSYPQETMVGTNAGVAQVPVWLDPATQPKFVNPLPVIKDLGLRIDATTGVPFTATMGPAIQDLGLIDPVSMAPLMSNVWGYGIDGGPVTYPGATFVARGGVPVTINWVNGLVFDEHLLPVDESLHWALSTTYRDPDGNLIEPDMANLQTFAQIGGIPAVAHLHGGHTDSSYDGLPEQWFSPGGYRGKYYDGSTYIYDNSQEAATVWYHDHALGLTRLNVYAGLAGFYLLRDDNEQYLIDNDLIPTGDYEIELVIQDRMFDSGGQLYYPSMPMAAGQPDISVLPEFFGNFILVNGKAWPFLNVEPRQYRFRLLNGSDSRFYELWLAPSAANAGPVFWVIGNDTGLLNRPVPVNRLLIGPGERYDVVVDFRGYETQQLVVRNNARSPFPKGATVNPNADGLIMAFNVGTVASGGVIAPLMATANLRPVANPVPAANGAGLPVRKLMLFEATDHYGRLQPLLGTVDPLAPVDANGNPIDGTLLWDDTTTENPALGATEIWEVHNATMDAHPIHLHLVAFQILDRQKFKATIVPKDNVDMHGMVSLGGALRAVKYIGQPKSAAAYEAGWKDTAIMYPGEVTRVVAKFDKPGRYVWHCHILSHEDHEMMRPYHVGPIPPNGSA
jgi:spore coat protein A